VTFSRNVTIIVPSSGTAAAGRPGKEIIVARRAVQATSQTIELDFLDVPHKQGPRLDDAAQFFR
jgi:hypothetical protein